MLRLTRQVTSDDGVELTLEGALNPSFASRLLPGGYAYEFDEGGTVKLTLKLRAAAKPVVINEVVRDSGDLGKWAGLERRPYPDQGVISEKAIDASKDSASNEQKETLDEQLAKEKQEEV